MSKNKKKGGMFFADEKGGKGLRVGEFSFLRLPREAYERFFKAYTFTVCEMVNYY